MNYANKLGVSNVILIGEEEVLITYLFHHLKIALYP